MQSGVKIPKFCGCVLIWVVQKLSKNTAFAKIPCFSLFLTVLVVCRTQVLHKPKVKGFLHRHLLFSVFLYSTLNGKFKS